MALIPSHQDKDFNGEIRLTYDVVGGHGGSAALKLGSLPAACAEITR
ncbi:hypothetical protein OK016_23995 [Vibrio chagasii]|nr:hypothetical protein [Vibrio chagasii]